MVISLCRNVIRSNLRDLSTHIGSGGGSRQLLPLLRTTTNLKNTEHDTTTAYYDVGGQGAGGTTLASSFAGVAVVAVVANSKWNDTSTFITTKGHMLVQSSPRSSSWEVITLHKRRAHSDSLVKCCFASPVSERTAFACYKLSRNLLCLQNKTDSSSKSTLIPIIGRYSTLSSLIKLHNASHKPGSLNYIQYRNFVTSAARYLSSTMANNGNGSLARQNFHEDCEAKINMQINMELYASYVYMAMAYYFDREDVALPGFSKWFKKNSDEEREHAEKFMKYQNQRGGRIVLQPIAKPTKDEWSSALEAVTDALELEKTVNKTLLELHSVAGTCNDPQLCDFLESNYLEEQVHAIKELSEMVTKLKRVGTGLGEYIFDKDLACAE